ncbi:cardiolipin synthase [Paenibacillus sp. GCM10023252]|uniref:cardiolipin synthase n=1 Tax=Paenibacillus sp. GCM10023252 TaxID=3252649 RepID=UPI00361CFC34
MKRRLEYMLVVVIAAILYILLGTDAGWLVKAAASVLYASIILYSMYSLVLENRTPQHTLLWLYVLLFFPLFGYIFYLYSGQLYLKGYLFRSKRKNDREEWHRLVKDGQTFDQSLIPEAHLGFAHYAQRVAITAMDTETHTSILRNGEETFDEIKRRLREARHYIHIQYYIFRSDLLGQSLMDILIQKAGEGVEVRFLYDGLGSLSLAGSDIARMKEAGIAVHGFLPIKYAFFNQKFNFRNHRKIIVIDGSVGFVGGLNVGVEYLGEDKGIGFWRDTHMVMEGSAVQTLHAVFLLDWDYAAGECLLEDPRYTEAKPAPGSDGVVHVVASGPDTQQGVMGDMLYTMIASARESIWIATPYFIPNEAIRTALRVAANRGVQVQIMVPEINDGYLTQYATRSYFPELLRCGVEIYSYQKGFLHQKITIVDGDLATIGTANMDMRSFHLNFEVNVFLMGASSIRDLVQHYEDDRKDSTRVMPVQFYKRGRKERTKESFARLFSGVL